MPKMVDLCLNILVQLKRESLIVLLVEQSTARALDVGGQVCVLSSGVQVYQGTAVQAKADGSMFATFLGIKKQHSDGGCRGRRLSCLRAIPSHDH
jgi:branched-chain amino acid transport system ATP-binding protein